MMNQFGPKGTYANYIGTSGPNHSMINSYFMNPLVDPTMLSAILASGLGSNMIDPLSAISYLNQMGSYQDILRHYQNNLSSLTNLAGGLNNPGTTIPTGISNTSTMSTTSSSINTSSNVGNLSNLNNMMVQQLLSLSNSTASTSTSRSAPMYHQATTKTSTTMSMTKDRPNISITPVSSTSLSQQPPHKTKPVMKQPNAQTDALPVHIPKSLQISPTKPMLHSSSTAQVSLLKPSVIQQVKASPPKQMSAPQIRVAKSLTEPQPAHNPSLSHSPLKSSSNATNPTVVPQVAHTVASIGAPVIMKQSMPMNLPTSRSGTSLQHKLLSKKNSQRPYSHTSMQNLGRKTKVTTNKTMPVLTPNYPNLLNAMPSSASMSQPPFLPPELSAISVSPVTQTPVIKTAASVKYHGYKKSSVKPKSTTVATVATVTAVDVPSSLSTSFSQSSSVEALSMLSQLQQHSHLEIIPQQKAPLKPNMDYPGKGHSSVTVMPQKITSEALRTSTTTECLPMYDIPRGKPTATNVSSKKTDKLATNDSVEIITLDD